MRSFAVALISLLLPASLTAGPVFPVSVDTSSLAGSGGAVYFLFSPGLASDPAEVSISGFTVDPPGALMGAPTTTGDVSGMLPGTVTLANTDAANDYLHFLTFGSVLQFAAEFELPAVLTGPSGSQFSFGLTGLDGLSPLLSQDPSGFLGIIAYDENATFQALSLDPSTLLAAVPEPGATLLAGPALLAFLLLTLKRQ